MPICSTCHEDKPPEAFALRSKVTGELQSHCRTCHAAYRRQHYLDNKAIYIAREVARIKRFREQNRVLLFQYLAGHPCVDCGETDVLVLEFDHRDPSTKQGDIGYLVVRKPWPVVLEEIEKCDVRCTNCHRRRTAAQFAWGKRERIPVERHEATPTLDVTGETKVCSRCKELRPLVEFPVKNRRTGRRSSFCRACRSAYGKDHYRRNRAAYMQRAKENRKAFRSRNRARRLDYLVGLSCIDCGESDPLLLEFDHRDGVQKEAAIARLVAQRRWSELDAEIAKCDVRCANCHRRRTAQQFGWTKLRLQQGLSEDSTAYVTAVEFELPTAGVA